MRLNDQNSNAGVCHNQAPLNGDAHASRVLPSKTNGKLKRPTERLIKRLRGTECGENDSGDDVTFQ